MLQALSFTLVSAALAANGVEERQDDDARLGWCPVSAGCAPIGVREVEKNGVVLWSSACGFGACAGDPGAGDAGGEACSMEPGGETELRPGYEGEGDGDDTIGRRPFMVNAPPTTQHQA